MQLTKEQAREFLDTIKKIDIEKYLKLDISKIYKPERIKQHFSTIDYKPSISFIKISGGGTGAVNLHSKPTITNLINEFKSSLRDFEKGIKTFFNFEKRTYHLCCSECGENLFKYDGGLYSEEFAGVYCPDNTKNCFSTTVLKINKKFADKETIATAYFLPLKKLQKLYNEGKIIQGKGTR